MIEIVNLIYCKKYLFLLYNQEHPAQYHKKKQETFLMIYGKILFRLINQKRFVYFKRTSKAF